MPNELVPGILRRALAVLILLSVIPMGLVPDISQDASAYTPHAPILINGNGDFTAANGVTAGSGTPADPYVIEGWEIEANLWAAIRIEATDAHFTIRDVYLHAAPGIPQLGNALEFYNVSNGRLEGSLVEETEGGTVIQYSEGVALVGNTFEDWVIIEGGAYIEISGNNFSGVYGDLVSDFSGRDFLVANNSLSGGSLGFGSPQNLTVTGNRMVGTGGVYVTSFSTGVSSPHYTGPPHGVNISENRVSDCGIGIAVEGYLLPFDQPGDVNVARNVIAACNTGVSLEGVIASVTVRDNYIANSSNGLDSDGGGPGWVTSNEFWHNEYGARLWMSGGLEIHHNNFIDNTVQAFANNSVADAWDNGYPSGGNYWSDYTGPDDCSGPNQNVCPDRDGIGDVPRIIEDDTPGMPPGWLKDRYPLIAPHNLDLPPHPPRMLPARLAGAGLSDVELVWELSRDDGSGAKDVTHYEVWGGDILDPSGANYTLLASLPPGSTTYLHSGGGAGDPSSHFYQVRATDLGNQSTPANEQAGKHTQFLPAGRHLLSVPLEQANWSIDVAMQTIPWSGAWSYGNGPGPATWTYRDPAKAWSTFELLSSESGFWVETGTASWWIVAGLVPTSTQIALRSGWNLIGYPSFTPRSVSEVLAGVAYDNVEGYADDPPYYLRTLDTSDTMEAGMGYWILVPADTSLFITI